MKKLYNLTHKIFLLIFYRNDTELITFPGKKDRDFFIWQAVFGTVVVNLMFTTFLSGVFIHFDTPDGILGYIPILPSIAGILIIFSGMLTEKVRNVKRTVILLNIIAKLLILFVVFIPLIISNVFTPYYMMISAFFGFLCNAVMGILINNWFIEVVDEKIRGRYMSVRQVFTLVVSATIPILAGKFLDGNRDKYIAFCIIFTIGFLFSLLESFALSKVDVPKKEEHEFIHIKFLDLFKIPLKNKKFMKFIFLMVFFHLFWNLSMTFASVYQIKYMEISYTYINLMMALGAIIQVFIYPVIGRMIDKYGSNFVMRIAFFFFMIHGLLYFMMIKSNAYLIFFLLNVNVAFINPAWILSMFNERFKLIPRQGRTVYDGFFIAVLGISILCGPVLGNVLRNSFIGFNTQIIDFQEFRFLFLITFVVLFVLNIVMYILARIRNRNNPNYVKFQLFNKRR